MKRPLILLSALAMQLCLGATYSWPVFVRPLRDLTGLSQGFVQFPFTLFYFAFPATMVLAGWLLPRLGPRRSAFLGGLLFGSGWILASLGRLHFAFTMLGIGLVAGVGVGFAYIVPIAVCVQWFPRQKGLVTGLAVAGFGGGAALIGRVGAILMQEWGKTPFEAFALLGCVFLLVVSLTGLLMEPAPGVRMQAADRLPAAGIVRRKEFLILYGAMSAGLAAGFGINANLKELPAPLYAGSGVLAVGLFALANALGRVSWGALFDRVKPAEALSLNLLLQAALLLASFGLLQSSGGFLAFATLAGFNYGGVLVLYASSAARLWGTEHVGQVYGLLFSANILAAPVPVLTGLGFDLIGSFAPSFIVLVLLLGAAALWIRREAERLNSQIFID